MCFRHLTVSVYSLQELQLALCPPARRLNLGLPPGTTDHSHPRLHLPPPLNRTILTTMLHPGPLVTIDLNHPGPAP
jgi:hypothetical protein